MPSLHPAAGAVVITDDLDEGIACFRIATASATYFYDKAGAGFTSIVDRDGIDWIGFHPEGTPGVAHGQWGWYRGLPNMARGVFGHPGYTGATSTTADPQGVPLPRATVRSSKGEWRVSWEFHPSCAKMTVLSAPARYWLLYEGTPGGALGADDRCGRSDGWVASCALAWEEDVVNTSGVATGMEWVYFADATLERSLVLLHDDDDVIDSYRPMDGMTVFGFGRAHRARGGARSLLRRVMARIGGERGPARGASGLLDRVPASLIIGLVEAREFAAVKARIDAIHREASDSGARAASEPGGRGVGRASAADGAPPGAGPRAPGSA